MIAFLLGLILAIGVTVLLAKGLWLSALVWILMVLAADRIFRRIPF